MMHGHYGIAGAKCHAGQSRVRKFKRHDGKAGNVLVRCDGERVFLRQRTGTVIASESLPVSETSNFVPGEKVRAENRTTDYVTTRSALAVLIPLMDGKRSRDIRRSFFHWTAKQGISPTLVQTTERGEWYSVGRATLDDVSGQSWALDVAESKVRTGNVGGCDLRPDWMIKGRAERPSQEAIRQAHIRKTTLDALYGR